MSLRQCVVRVFRHYALENSVLLAQEFDHVPLLPFDPSEQRRDKAIQPNHRGSLRHCLVDPVLRHYANDDLIRSQYAVGMETARAIAIE